MISASAPPPAPSTGTVRRRAMVASIGILVVVVSAPLAGNASGAPGDDSTASTTTSAPASTAPPDPTTTTMATSTTSSTPSSTPPESSTTTSDPAPATTETSSTTIATTTTTTTTTTTVAPLPPELGIPVLAEQTEHILATIRHLESRGIYTLPPNRGNASGAYQYIESTWNRYAGFQHAYLAPPSVQDERAALDVAGFLERFEGDVSMIPVMWYYPKAAREIEWMDRVPRPDNGNVLTVREYQTRWLAVFATISGEPVADALLDDAVVSGGAPDVTGIGGDAAAPPAMSFPVLGPSRMAIPDCGALISGSDSTGRAEADVAGLCTPEAPAVVFGVKLQPVLAVADGVVTEVRDRPGSGEPISVTITDQHGRSVRMAGFNDDSPGTDDGNAPSHLRLTALARVGTVVRAGQVLGFMGDSSPLPLGIREPVPTDSTVVIDPDAVAPHIRVSVVDVAGQPLDSFGPVVDALFGQTCRVLIGQWSVPGDGGGHEPVVIETTDDDDAIDSEWIITPDGQVHAAGWAAMVNPSDDCAFTPSEHHGPGAAGSGDWLPHWLEPYDLETTTWVATALHDAPVSPVSFVG